MAELVTTPVTNEDLQNLYTFIRAQDPARKVNHNCWATCAIGEFLATDPNVFEERWVAARFANSALEQKPELWDVLNGDTYGHMWVTLEEKGL